jgi:DNA-binding transcriptional LysR family regulator
VVLDLGRLRYFVAVAEHRSFSRAADELLIAQPAVSRQVAMLESELGVRLLDRSTHEVKLTAAGEALFERGTVLLRDADELWAATRKFGQGASARVTVGYSTSLGYETAPLLVRAVLEAVPDLTLEAVVMSSVELGDAVVRRTIDLALMRCPVANAELSATVVRRERIGVLVRAGHPLAGSASVELSDIRKERLALHERAANPKHFDLIAGACRAAGFEPRLMETTTPFDPGFSVVADGTAVGIVGESATQGLPAGLAYIPLETAPRVDVGLLMRRDQAEPHVLRAHDEIVAAAQAERWIRPSPGSS